MVQRKYISIVGVCATIFWQMIVCVGASAGPETVAHALGRYHIKLTEEALVEALRSPVDAVRGLAAAELAEQKDSRVLPFIIASADDERDTLTRINIASAAVWLGSSEGERILKRTCGDINIPTYLRVTSAGNMSEQDTHGCLPGLLATIWPGAQSDDKISVLSFASQFYPRTPEETTSVLSKAMNALDDDDIGVRLIAVQALRSLNEPASIPGLREAIEREREDGIRSEEQSCLRYLLSAH
jgi:HEAT repeat protein